MQTEGVEKRRKVQRSKTEFSMNLIDGCYRFYRKQIINGTENHNNILDDTQGQNTYLLTCLFRRVVCGHFYQV